MTLIAWYRKTLCIASLIVSIPRNEKEKLERPPLTRAPGRVCLKNKRDDNHVYDHAPVTHIHCSMHTPASTGQTTMTTTKTIIPKTTGKNI